MLVKFSESTLNKNNQESLVDLANSAIKMTESLLKQKKSFNFMTESSFDAYILYLNRLSDYILSLNPYDFDHLVASICDWNVENQNSISNSVKNIVISNILLLKALRL